MYHYYAIIILVGPIQVKQPSYCVYYYLYKIIMTFVRCTEKDTKQRTPAIGFTGGGSNLLLLRTSVLLNVGDQPAAASNAFPPEGIYQTRQWN